jgi:signal transduction histidine kinase
MQIGFIQNLIAPPTFEDEDKNRVARLLHTLLMAILALDAVYALSGILTQSSLSLVYALVIAALTLLMHFIARRGYVRLAAAGFITGLWLIFSIPWLANPLRGIYASNFSVYMIPVILAGFLLGWRASLFVAALNTLVGLLVLLDTERETVLPGVTRPVLHWSALSLSFFVAAVLVKLATDNITQAIARARAGECALAERNRELQREIEERRQAEARLLLAEQRLRLALEVARMTIWDWDLSTNHLTFTRNTPLNQEQRVESISLGDFIAIIHPQDRDIIPNALRRTIEDNAPYDIEFRVNRAGDYIWLATMGRLFRDDAGTPTHVIGVSNEITERKLAEQERVDLAVARQRVEMLTEFLGNISHDFKTPVSVINNSLYLIRRDPEKHLDKFETIQSQATLLDKYVQDILTIIRLDHGPEIVPVPVDVNAGLRAVCQRLQVAADKKSIALNLELDPFSPAVSGDSGELDRLMVNLIENAINYTPQGGQITVRTQRHDASAVIEIADTGIGIPQEDRDHIFERFYRSARARSSGAPGTGLGLAIVKKIVDLHDGVIEVESAPAEGTTFRVTLPII